ncbi:MAG: hypothetical protein UW02_C0026G0001 [Candidatus Nomurabacteria bacterium GW2011_GWB1_43_7]|uniref:Uncharacterized protein n=1 Tax=Candidatus Nomurabacteria bacterium GW2011_GWB1_43_7 TaxID=1618747 RepID=A0A0G1F8G4_9BACT|nr:MAG: hypothetical protein UW02_C0026G0001 [Candidatus Nomurabacteria bacterium GW2011_GWB1_43_7]
MKNQKGFAGIGIIIAIVAVLLAGGVAYYVGKSSNNIDDGNLFRSGMDTIQEDDYLPAENQNVPVVNSDNTNSTPSITVLSPNGGETWKSGQSQTIKWKYSSLPDLEQGGKKYPVVVSVGLFYQDVSIENQDEYGGGRLCWLGSVPISAGSFSFTSTIGSCPNPNSSRPIIKEGNYKVVIYAGYSGGYEGDNLAEDESDNSFIIVKTNTITSSDLVNNICKVNSDCRYIWYTGGCNTPEYVGEIMKKCQDKSGPCPSEAQPRENVTCTCESNKCVTHN